jgi:hypothetical protein
MPGIQLPQNPIFIVGYPRSGTTLLQRLLVTQPRLYSLPETHYFSVLENEVRFDEQGVILPTCLEGVVEKIAGKIESRFTGEEIKTLYLLAREKQLSSKQLFEFIVAHFLVKQGVVPDSAGFRWIEKTPGHANFLGRIFTCYPGAQVLHILRHPVPAIFSRKFKFPFNKETPAGELARRWNRFQENVESAGEMFPGRIYTLRYENLVRDPKKEMETVGHFLSLCFDFVLASNLGHQDSSSLFSPSEAWKRDDMNRTPGITDTNNAYKALITRAEAEAVEAVVKEKMDRYGYKPYFN